MAYEELTRKIIGCAFEVYNRMGFGFKESVYEKCLMIELERAGVAAVNQASVTVRYVGHVVGQFVADIVVENRVIVEIKSVRQIAREHEVQLVNYLVATGNQVGLLLNFADQGVEVKRKVRELPSKTRQSPECHSESPNL